MSVNDHVYYTEQGKEVYRLNDGSKRITPVIVSEKNQQAFNKAIASGKATIGSLKGFGVTYDTKAMSKFFTDYHNKFIATNVEGQPILKNSALYLDGKKIPNNSLHAEAVANIVYGDGVATIGKSSPTSTGGLTGSDPEGPAYEPNLAGSAHLHPFADKHNITLDDLSGEILGGIPSPADFSDHARRVKLGHATNGVRSVMVDAKYIYLYNSDRTETIKVPRL